MQALCVCGLGRPALFPEPNENDGREPEKGGQDPKSPISPDARVSSLVFPALAKSHCFMGAELPLLVPHNVQITGCQKLQSEAVQLLAVRVNLSC